MDLSLYSTHAEIEAGIIKYHIVSIFDKFIQNLDENYQASVQNVHESERGQEALSEIEKWEKHEQELNDLKHQSGETEDYLKLEQDFYYALPGFPNFPQSKLEVAQDTLREMISQEVLNTFVYLMHNAIERMSLVLSKEQQKTVLRVGHIKCSEELDQTNETINAAIQEFQEGVYDNWVNRDRYYDYFSVFKQMVSLITVHVQAREIGYKGEIPVPLPHGWKIPHDTDPTPGSIEISFIPDENNRIKLPLIQRKAAICTFITCSQLGLTARLPEAAEVVCAQFSFERTPHPKSDVFAKELNKCKNGEIEIKEPPPYASQIIELITPLLRELQKTL